MSHHCHATGCAANVPPQMFLCRRHWFSLPKRMRDAIWATYRPGQCDDWRITPGYAQAAREAIRFLAAKEGLEPDTAIYDVLDPTTGGAIREAVLEIHDETTRPAAAPQREGPHGEP